LPNADDEGADKSLTAQGLLLAMRGLLRSKSDPQLGTKSTVYTTQGKGLGRG